MSRFGFVLRRPLQLIPVLIGISLVTFVLVQLTPGDPVRLMLGPKASEAAIAAIRARYGLDQPVLIQYFYYTANAVRGDLGLSLAYRSNVGSIIIERLPPTLFLLLYGLGISIVLTFLLASFAARNHGRTVDHLIRLFCIAGIGIPSYFAGLMLIMVFSLRLKLFPVSGFAASFLENLWHLFLPSFTVAIAVTPLLTRNLRATLIQQLDADYAVAVRSRGLSERTVFYRHVFWNSLLPTINLLGVVMSFLIGGTVVIENVFNIPGLGQLLVRGVLIRDYFIVQGITLVLAIGIVITNFLVDLMTVMLDPRVRF
jgi:peptide/nickel transport system permease protein